ncbi:hypothetical protein BDZ45DRAFT_675328 [Acephala macrosclerotiorum]|nr:hypothetical protein BDZ45DRAFT_675328 [Acephala macrosclerotiorum]
MSILRFVLKALPSRDKVGFMVNSHSPSFLVDDATSIAISGLTLRDLQSSGRLFLVGHSYQAKDPTTAGRYGGACNPIRRCKRLAFCQDLVQCQ